jgi:hypothetical protein
MARETTTRRDAEAIAISALGFIASEPELLSRFLAITGIEASAIRRAASEPGFLAGVMQFIVAHEPTLLRFAEASGTPPGAVLAAQRALPQGDDSYEAST